MSKKLGVLLQEESEVGQDDEGCEDKVAKVNWTTLTAMKVPASTLLFTFTFTFT